MDSKLKVGLCSTSSIKWYVCSCTPVVPCQYLPQSIQLCSYNMHSVPTPAIYNILVFVLMGDTMHINPRRE